MRRPADGRATKRFSSTDPDSFRRALMPSVRPPPTEVNTTTGALRMSMRIFRQKGGVLAGRRPPSWTHRVAGAMRATERGPAPPRPSECPSVQLVRDPELRHVVRPERPEDRTPGTLDRDPGAAQEEIVVDAVRQHRLEAEDAAPPGEEDEAGLEPPVHVVREERDRQVVVVERILVLVVLRGCDAALLARDRDRRAHRQRRERRRRLPRLLQSVRPEVALAALEDGRLAVDGGDETQAVRRGPRAGEEGPAAAAPPAEIVGMRDRVREGA